MQENLKEHTAQLKKKKRRTTLTPYVLIVGAALAAAYGYFRYKENIPEIESHVRQLFEPDSKPTKAPESAVDQQQQYRIEPTSLQSQSSSEVQQVPLAETEQENPEISQADGLQTGQDSSTLTDRDYEEALDSITMFFEHLDQQPYMQSFQLNAPSKIYFPKLIQKILDTPPLVSGETDNLFSILQNTAHFFRVVGKDNISTMKAILDQEKGSIEVILAKYYTLSHRPEYLQQNLSIQVQEDSIYTYAGFFLTTMGGRLYLFRRDAMLRILVSYYSILIVDEANKLGNNSNGIDIKPTVDSLISEIENSGNQLKLKEQYLDNLYRIKEKNL